MFAFYSQDIPEGGGKAVIILALHHQDKAKIAFRKFTDAILDLLCPTEPLVDLYGKKVTLFLGPDEGSAGFMDWAAMHAKTRGLHNWKARGGDAHSGMHRIDLPLLTT